MITAPEKWMVEWNDVDPPAAPVERMQIHDETLRDGLHSPAARRPGLGDKLRLLHLMGRIGVDSACLGTPATSPGMRRDVSILAAEMASARIPVAAACAVRNRQADVAVVAEIAQATGLPIWVTAFVGISPMRADTGRRSAASAVRTVQDTVRFACGEGLRVCLVTDDTTGAAPELAKDVYAAALGEGAERICVYDAVGDATPWVTTAVVTKLRRDLDEMGYPDAGIDWHGHDDRGLAVANSLAAASAGASRLHGTALGAGGRAGNAAIEQLLVNLSDIRWRTSSLEALPRYCELAGRLSGVGISGNQPFIGKDVYRTATGVHAAAIRKAQRLGSSWLAERVYAGVPASVVGREQAIEIGPGSGRANILCWLDKHHIAAAPSLVREIQRAVAHATRIFTDEELFAITHITREGTGRAGGKALAEAAVA
jgi:isopropylmalate/homocitrate/citramalate synthase